MADAKCQIELLQHQEATAQAKKQQAAREAEGRGLGSETQAIISSTPS